MVVNTLKTPSGYLDGLVNGALCGWLWSGFDDGKSLSVVFLDGDRPIGKTVADIYREDLLKAGIGNGCYSFSWQLPNDVYDGDEHLFRAVDAASGQNLIGSPVACQLTKTEIAHSSQQSSLTPEQWLDWLEDLSFPTVASRLQRYDALAYLYLIILGREPDEHGVSSYLKRMDKSVLSYRKIAEEMIESEEFKSNLGCKLMRPECVIRIYEERLTIYASATTDQARGV